MNWLCKKSYRRGADTDVIFTKGNYYKQVKYVYEDFIDEYVLYLLDESNQSISMWGEFPGEYFISPVELRRIKIEKLIK